MERRVLYGLVVMLMYLVSGGFSQDIVSQEELKLMNELVKWEQFLTVSEVPIVVTATSSVCGLPCALVKEQVAQLAKTYGNRIVFYEADILEKPFFVKIYKIIKVPTVIVFKDGQEIKRLEQNFYWGSIYDLIFKVKIFYSAPSPSNSAPPPLDSALSVLPPFDEAGWEQFLSDTKLPIMVTVTSSLCGVPCDELKDRVAILAQYYGSQIRERIKFINIDVLENPFFARLYKLLNVPTIIVFNGGEEIFRSDDPFNWGKIYDLVFGLSMLDFAPSPSGLPPLSGE